MISRLESVIQKGLAWLESNMMVAKPSQVQVMFMGLGNGCKLCIEIDKMVSTNAYKVILLCVIIDSKLKFDEHFKSLCLNQNRNVSALSRAATIIDQPKCKLLYNSLLCQNSGVLISVGCSVEKC